MLPDDAKRKIARIAEVDDVLPRGTQQVSRFSGRQEILTLGLSQDLCEFRSHNIQCQLSFVSCDNLAHLKIATPAVPVKLQFETIAD